MFFLFFGSNVTVMMIRRASGTVVRTCVALFDFNAENLDGETRTELLGFVSINLDFVIFHDRLLANIKFAIVLLLILLAGFALWQYALFGIAASAFMQSSSAVMVLTLSAV